jgi:hypothetical protein
MTVDEEREHVERRLTARFGSSADKEPLVLAGMLRALWHELRGRHGRDGARVRDDVRRRMAWELAVRAREDAHDSRRGTLMSITVTERLIGLEPVRTWIALEDEPLDVRLGLRVTRYMMEHIKEAAADRGQSVGDFVREAIAIACEIWGNEGDD